MHMLQPPQSLRGHVQDFWALSGQITGQYSGLPKPYIEFVISLSGTHLWQRTPDDTAYSYEKGWVTPLQFGARFAETKGPLHLIGARLSLKAAKQLLGAAPLLEASTPIPIDELIGHEAEHLREQLLSLPTEHHRLLHLAQWTEQRLAHRPPLYETLPPPEVLTKLGWRIDTLAEYYDISTRGLRKRFHAQFGLSPKLWLQLTRFDQVIRFDIASNSLAETAATFGYADQSHLSHEFKRFAGRSPGLYLGDRQKNDAPEEAPHFVPDA